MDIAQLFLSISVNPRFDCSYPLLMWDAIAKILSHMDLQAKYSGIRS